MTKISPSLKLSNGVEIPRIGLGVWKIDNSKVSQVVEWALKAGYRHIDTATAYQNEEGVGQGIRLSGVPRQEIFVTTKIIIYDYFRPEEAIETSLNKLKLDYVDLYLIHRPFLGWKNAWRALEKIYQSGRARSIGVSNFGIHELEALKKMGGLMPMVNQVELSPFLNRQKLVEYCQSHGIIVEAYSPLTRGRRLDNQTVIDLAKKYHQSAAQIMIRWGLQHGLVMLPKSENKKHLENNFAVFNFEINDQDLKKLDSLNDNFTTLPFWSHG